MILAMSADAVNAWMVVIAFGSMGVAFFTMFLGFIKLLLEVRKVHGLVNSRSEQQDAKINELRLLLAHERRATANETTQDEKIARLEDLLAKERRTNLGDKEGNI